MFYYLIQSLPQVFLPIIDKLLEIVVIPASIISFNGDS